MKREVRFFPAFDKRAPEPEKNYGVHGVEIHFILSGEHGAVVFRLYTRWMLPQTYAFWEDELGIPPRYKDQLPSDAGVLFHSAKPIYEGHTPSEDDCTYLGKPCYQDIGYTMGKEPLDLLIAEGDEAVWKWLEAMYQERLAEPVTA